MKSGSFVVTICKTKFSSLFLLNLIEQIMCENIEKLENNSEFSSIQLSMRWHTPVEDYKYRET